MRRRTGLRRGNFENTPPGWRRYNRIMTDPNDKYLFLAYTLVWIVFMVYAWILSRRQSRLRMEINDLKARKPAADGKG